MIRNQNTEARRRKKLSLLEKVMYDKILNFSNLRVPNDHNASERRNSYAKILKVFNKIDTDGDGLLSYEEFDSSWKELGLSGGEGQRKRAFAAIDTNKSGTINFREFIR